MHPVSHFLCKVYEQPKTCNTDYRNLLRKVRQPMDLPLPTITAKLQEEWHCQKHRYDEFVVTSPKKPTTCNVDTGVAYFPTPVQVPVQNVREQEWDRQIF
jgi:hypothetical protein